MKRKRPPGSRENLSLLVFLIGVCIIAYAQWWWTRMRLEQGLFFMLLGIVFVAISCTERLLDPASPEAALWRPRPIVEADLLFSLLGAARCPPLLPPPHHSPRRLFAHDPDP